MMRTRSTENRPAAAPSTGQAPTLEEVMGVVEHTLLHPEATRDEVEAGIDLAARLGTVAVVVQPWDVAWAAERMNGSRQRLVTTVSFPHGNDRSDLKVAQALAAVADGADELDVVMNIGAFRSGDRSYVEEELRGVVDAVGGSPVKVIIESAYLTPAEVVDAALMAVSAGAAYVKNGTGFSPRGADEAEIAAIRRVLPPAVGVKASGGVRQLDALLRLVDAGASRVGTSSTASIAAEWSRRYDPPDPGRSGG
jgi:deoxyribose-phosphate aldolase